MSQERSTEITFRQVHQDIADELLRQWNMLCTGAAVQLMSDVAPVVDYVLGLERLDVLVRRHTPELLDELDGLTGRLLDVLDTVDDVASLTKSHPVLHELEELTERTGISERFAVLSQAEGRYPATRALLAGEDEGFLLRHLADHLDAARRWEELHELVAEGDNRQEWAAQQFAWTLDFNAYLSDVRRIYEHAQEELTPAHSHSLQLQWLSRSLRYALIQASINSIVVRVPKELVIALIEAQVWSARQAFEYAQQVTDKEVQGRLITALSPHLPTKESLAAIHILTQAQYSGSSHGTGMSTTNQFLKDYLQTAEVDGRALELCCNLLTSPATRGDGLALLQTVRRVTAESGDLPTKSVTQNLLNIVSRDWSSDDQAAALLGVIPLLDLENLRLCVLNMEANYYCLRSHQHDAVLAEIAVRAAQIADGTFATELVQTRISAASWRAAALCRISRTCGSDRKTELIRAAVQCVTTQMWLGLKRDGELARELLPRPTPGAEPFLHLDEMPIEALIVVLPVLGEGSLFEQGVFQLLEQWHPKDGAWLVPQASKDLSVAQQILLFRRVLDRLRDDSPHNDNRIHRQRALEELAPYLPDVLLPNALIICRSVLDQIKAGFSQFDPVSLGFRGDEMLTGNSLTISDFLGFMSADETYSDYMDHVRLVLALARRDIDRFLPDVLSMFEEITDDVAQLDARTSLCPLLPANEFITCLRVARSLASGLSHRQEPAIKWQVTATALARLALQAPNSQRKDLIAETLAVARAVKERSRQQHIVTMIEICRILEDQEQSKRRNWLLEALESALGIDDRLAQVELLVDLLSHSSPEYQRRVVRLLLQLISQEDAFPRRVKDSLSAAAVQEDREEILMKVLPVLAANSFYAEIQQLGPDFAMMSSEHQQEVIQLLKKSTMSTSTAGIVARARRLLQEAERNSKPAMKDSVVDPTRDPTQCQLVAELSAQIDALRLLPRKRAYEQCRQIRPAVENLSGAEGINQLYTTVEKIGRWWP